MALSPKLELRQSQMLVMTPQLQQAIKLLQLSNLDLSAYVEQELESNPLLERDEPDRDSAEAEAGVADDPIAANGEAAASGEAGASGEAAEDSDPALRDTSAHLSDSETLPSEGEGPLNIDYASAYADDDAPGSTAPSEPDYSSTYGGAWSGGRGGSRDFGDSTFSLEQTASADISLKEHLTGQLNVDIDDPVDRLIGANLIDLLDDAGYLSSDLASVAERVGCDEARVETTLAALQQFDPPGVFARDLAECLALQLADRDRLDPAMRELLDNLNLVADHDIAGLVAACGVDDEDVRDMLAEIRSLNPKPGLAFDNETAQPIVPDVFIRRASNGQWLVELNNDTLPRLLVNRSYHARIDGQAKSQADKAYIAEHLSSANWLMKSLDQRANTILKVATELVVQQETFLLYGVEYLRPLNLRDIAQAIDMHESTVSRVTANKYLATSRGIYPMKYFFTSAIPSSGGGASHSAEAVRHRIRDLIDQEPPDAVFSDDKIVEMLRIQGVDIARRTVAKYREAMRIPSSVERRRRKRLLARAS